MANHPKKTIISTITHKNANTLLDALYDCSALSYKIYTTQDYKVYKFKDKKAKAGLVVTTNIFLPSKPNIPMAHVLFYRKMNSMFFVKESPCNMEDFIDCCSEKAAQVMLFNMDLFNK